MNIFECMSAMKKFEDGIMTPNEARSALGLQPIPQYDIEFRLATKKTNCPNCCAPLPRDGHCEYCGTYVN